MSILDTDVALVQPAVAAKSAAEVQAIARAVTVEIRLQADSSVGSGIIVAHQGDLYTIATNRHVVCGQGSRNKSDKLDDVQGALADYNKAIALNPQSVKAYYNREILKEDKLNDVQGALADYNKAITLDPKDALAYYNRGGLKVTKLNDIQGALADYDRAITLNPQLATAYSGRGGLKAIKLNDKAGAIQDIRQVAKLFRAQGQTQYLQTVLDFLRQLGAPE